MGGASAVIAFPRSAHTSRGIDSGVNLMVSHARLSAAAASGGDAAQEKRLLFQQGEILMRAGLKLLDEGA